MSIVCSDIGARLAWSRQHARDGAVGDAFTAKRESTPFPAEEANNASRRGRKDMTTGIL